MDLGEALSWQGELTCIRHDQDSGAWFVIALDSTRRGPAAGGTRAMTYPSLGDAVADASQLASAMTLKMAITDLPMGGGKSVLVLPRPRAELDEATWRRILELHAANLESLGGSYVTGPDVGTSSRDMDLLGRSTAHVFGRSLDAGGAGSSAEMTAHGVFAAIKAATTEAGRPDLPGQRVLVQGLGAVGARVADLVAAQGAELLVTDVDPARCTSFQDLGAHVVAPDQATSTACDVFVPCATGGVIDITIARSLPAAVVAGAANNVLTERAAAAVLGQRGVVYAPDFVANAGGAVHLVGREVLGWSAETVQRRTAQLGDTLHKIFSDARARDVTTDQAARDLARERLSEPPVA